MFGAAGQALSSRALFGAADQALFGASGQALSGAAGWALSGAAGWAGAAVWALSGLINLIVEARVVGNVQRVKFTQNGTKIGELQGLGMTLISNVFREWLIIKVARGRIRLFVGRCRCSRSWW